MLGKCKKKNFGTTPPKERSIFPFNFCLPVRAAGSRSTHSFLARASQHWGCVGKASLTLAKERGREEERESERKRERERESESEREREEER